MTMIAIPDRITFTAPAPDAVATATVQTVGRRGLGTYYYWIVSHFPIGIVVSEPFGIWNAPDTLDATNYVNIVWTATFGATDYDVLRTLTPVYPSLPGNYALALGLTATQFQDQGQALSAYNVAGMPHGAPVSAFMILDNRDYPQPVLEIPEVIVKVTELLFSDGTSQTTAGGGSAVRIKGNVPNYAALVALPGPHEVGDGWITTDTGHLWVWNGTAWVDAGPVGAVTVPGGANGQIQFNSGGAFGASPNLAFEVMWGNTVPTLRSNGLNVVDTNPNEGVQVWYDAASGTPAGQGGIYAFNFSSQTYKRFYLDGDPLLLNCDVNNTGHVRIGGGVLPDTAANRGVLNVVNETSPIARGIDSLRYANDAGAAIFYAHKSRGTAASPLPVQAGDGIGYLGFGGQSTTLPDVEGASILAVTTGVGANTLAADLVFTTNPGTGSDSATERMRIASAGHVGIGTTTPQAKLTVVDDISPASGIDSVRYSNDTGAAIFYLSKARGTVAAPTGVQVNDLLGWFGFGGFNGTLGFSADAAAIEVQATGVTPTGVAGDLIFLTSDGTTDVAGAQRMRITAAGNVGINLPNPAYRLDVAGDVNCTGQFRVNGAPISPTVAVAATAPASPAVGALWYDNANFRLMIFLGSWVQVA